MARQQFKQPRPNRRQETGGLYDDIWSPGQQTGASNPVSQEAAGTLADIDDVLNEVDSGNNLGEAGGPSSHFDDNNSLNDREENGGTPPSQESNGAEQNKLGRGFTGGKQKGKASNDLLTKGSKKWLLAGGAGAIGGLAVIVMLVMLFLSSLGLPNFSTSITEYAFIRMGRQSSAVSKAVLNEAVGQQLSRRFSSVYTPLKERYSSVKTITTDRYTSVRSNTWGRFDNIRADKILQNLGSNGGLQFNYGLSSSGAVALEGISINGAAVEVPQKVALDWKQRLTPFVSDLVEFDRQATLTAELMPKIEKAMGTGTGSLLNRYARYKATKAILSEAGITRVGYTYALEKLKDTKLGSAAQSKLSTKALEIKDRAERIMTARGQPAGSSVGALTDAINETAAAERAALADNAAIEASAKSGAAPEIITKTASAAAEAASGANLASLSGALGAANTAYAIALPICLIYEGSMASPNAGVAIDNASKAAMQAYADVSSKADNMKRGVQAGQDPLAFASLSGATASALGNVSTYYGSNYNSPDVLGVEADATGSYGNYGGYTAIDLLLSGIGLDRSIISTYINRNLQANCPVITDNRVAIGSAVVAVLGKVVIGILSGGTSVAGEEGVKLAVETGIKNMIISYVRKSVISKVVSRQSSKWATSKFTEKEMTEQTLMKILWGNKLTLAAQGTKDATSFAAKAVAVVGAIDGATYLAKQAVANRAGQVYSAFGQNTELQTQAAIGAVAEANTISNAIGGRALTRTELQQTRAKDIAASNDIERSKSLYARYIDPRDYRSLTNHFVASISSVLRDGIVGRFLELTGTIFNPLKQLSTIGSLGFQNQALALDTGSDTYYHMVQFGFSEDEMNLLTSDRRYSMKENERVLAENQEKYDQLTELYAPCQGSIGTQLSQSLLARDDKGDIIDDPNVLCSPSNLSYKNPRFGDLVFRKRALTFQNQQLGSLEDLSKPPQARTQTAATPQPGATAPIGSGLVSGTDQELAKQIVASGKVSGDSRYMGQIKAYASGDFSCHINHGILQLIATGMQSHSLHISSLNRYCTGVLTDSGTKSYHYTSSGGHAVDFSMIDGNAVNGGNTTSLTFLRQVAPLLPFGTGIGQSQCRPAGSLVLPAGVRQYEDKCNHIHIQVPIQ